MGLSVRKMAAPPNRKQRVTWVKPNQSELTSGAGPPLAGDPQRGEGGRSFREGKIWEFRGFFLEFRDFMESSGCLMGSRGIPAEFLRRSEGK